MEEADRLLIENLKAVNIKVATLSDFDSPLFVKALIGCFEHISKMLSSDENFIDIKFLKS